MSLNAPFAQEISLFSCNVPHSPLFIVVEKSAVLATYTCDPGPPPVKLYSDPSFAKIPASCVPYTEKATCQSECFVAVVDFLSVIEI